MHVMLSKFHRQVFNVYVCKFYHAKHVLPTRSYGGA
jgi:hypothetical protein